MRSWDSPRFFLVSFFEDCVRLHSISIEKPSIGFSFPQKRNLETTGEFFGERRRCKSQPSILGDICR